MSYEWKSPNSKFVEWGGPLLGGILLYLGAMFYPAVVVGIQVGLFYKSYDDAVFPGFIAFLITAFVIWLLYKKAKLGSRPCLILLLFIYITSIGPAIQYYNHISDAEYLESWEYEQRLEELGIEWDPCLENNENWPQQAPFPGFDWLWWIPPADFSNNLK